MSARSIPPGVALAALALAVVLLVFAPLDGIAREEGIPGVAATGCDCHGNDPTPTVVLNITGLPVAYGPGEQYALQLAVSGGPPTNFGGFDLLVSNGILSTSDPNTRIVSRLEAVHTNPGNRTWWLNWTAPPVGAGQVTFSLAMNAVNGDGDSAAPDAWNTAVYRVPEGVPPNHAPEVGAITVTPPIPLANRSVSLMVQATDQDGDALRYTWDFGDGGSASGANTTHTFPAPGTYDVIVFVEDGGGGVGNGSLALLVRSRVPGDRDPTVTIGGDLRGNNETPVVLTARIVDPDGDSVIITWDLGDGTTADGATVSHRYPIPSTYVVTLLADDQKGGSARAQANVTIRPPNRAPEFAAGLNHSVIAGRPLVFEANGIDPDGDSLNYTWDFGDGTTETGRSATHTYRSPGHYMVFVTAQDPGGLRTTVNVHVMVHAAPTTWAFDPFLVILVIGVGIVIAVAYDGRREVKE